MMLQTWLPLLVAILVVGSAVTQGQQCGQNENYTTCGTACPLTCQRPVPTICTYQCVRGCFCNDGFILHDRNPELKITRRTEEGDASNDTSIASGDSSGWTEDYTRIQMW
ncbi:unnamed protein product [Hermetia illucens]|uniref:TIL domain-containing protein n=1 Tax=Hermetia illucens TaxID=343691 RepID=A0A7R8YVK4_HERIL|nr:unnamed protein product [Hermetia illucens]